MKRILAALALAACTGEPGGPGPGGADGTGGTFERDGDGVLLISCGDGSLAIVEPGRKGPPGKDGSGERGPPGPDAPAVLVDVRPVDRGACPPGGWAVQAGLDVNADRLLDPDEVTSQAVLCRAFAPCDVVHGDLTLDDPLRLVAFAASGCREVRGALRIADLPGTRSLPELAWPLRVRSLEIRDNEQLRDIAGFDIEGDVESIVIEGNTTLQHLTGLENVTSVAGAFRIRGNRFLPICRIEELRDRIGVENIGGPIEIDGEPCPP